MPRVFTWRTALVCAVVILTALSFVPARDVSASSSGYVLVNLVDTNNTAESGESFTSFSLSAPLNDNSEVAFNGQTATESGLFIASGGGSTKTMVLEGDPAPGTSGGTLGILAEWDLDFGGRVAFRSLVNGSAVTEGIFLATGTGVSELVLQGDFAPGTPQNTFDSFQNCSGLAMNAAGDVLFIGTDFVGFNVISGVFTVSTAISPTLVSLTGQAVNISEDSWNNSADAAFWNGNLKIGTPGGGLPVTFVSTGDPAPGTGGGLIMNFGTACFSKGFAPALNDADEKAFFATVTGGNVDQGIFHATSTNVVSAVALPGQAAPGTGGATFVHLGAPSLNNSGEVAFSAFTTASRGIFVSSGGTIAPVALVGQSLPGTGGGVLSGVQFCDGRWCPAINNKGEVAFRARVGGVDTFDGIFLALPGKGDSDSDDLTNDAEVNTHGTNPLLADTDGDGLSDSEEINSHGTDPLLADTDGDDMTDDFEVANSACGIDPLVNDAAADDDLDGLTNLQEFQLAEPTDPCDEDTDDDTLSDGEEVNTYGTDPLNPDTDDDGCTDGVEELGVDETVGGLRDPLNPWDLYDVLGGGGGPPDGIVDLSNDIFGVIIHYAPTGTEPEYDVNFDRGRAHGDSWNDTEPPDGVIDLTNDILGVIQQYLHDCS